METRGNLRTEMSTTTVFVEILVIGLEALVWIALLASSMFGLDWLSNLAGAFKNAETSTTLALIGVAYFIGILMDEVCDALLEPWSAYIRKSVRKEGQPEMWDIQAYIFAHSESATEKLEYVRSRVRVCRSSIFNVVLATVFALTLCWTQSSVMCSLPCLGRLNIAFVGIILTAGAAFVFWRLERAYWLRAQLVYKHLRANEKSSRSADKPALKT